MNVFARGCAQLVRATCSAARTERQEKETESGDICNFITTLMGFSIIQELHFLMHGAHKYKVQ